MAHRSSDKCKIRCLFGRIAARMSRTATQVHASVARGARLNLDAVALLRTLTYLDSGWVG